MTNKPSRKRRALGIGFLAAFLAGGGVATYLILNYGSWIGLERVGVKDLVPQAPVVTAPRFVPQTPELIPETQSQTRPAAQTQPESEMVQTQPEPIQQALPEPAQQDVAKAQPQPLPLHRKETQPKMTARADVQAAPQTSAQVRPKVSPKPVDASEPTEVIQGVPAKGSIVRPVIPVTPDAMADAVAELRQRNLLLPLRELKREDLRDSFNDARVGHIHQAIDILAPRNTPILAVGDGTIAKLWYSVPGGVTIYQADPQKKYEYYYAHLERYADGLKDGVQVKKGEVIGYVGTSGNAPKNTPHLHFTIFKLTESKHWWEGTPINPYLVFRSS